MMRRAGRAFWLMGLAVALPLLSQTSDFQKQFPWFAKERRQPVYPEILVDASWLAERLGTGKLVPVDVRPRPQYQAGHLPGAVNVSFLRDPSDTVDVRKILHQAGLRSGDTPVLVGADRSALGLAYLALSGAGWRDVKVLAGGYEAWKQQGLTISTGVSGRSAGVGDLPPLPKDSPFIDREELAAGFGRPGFEVLDLRDKGWGEDFAVPPRFAAGHVPHALPFDIADLLDAHNWPDPAQARATLGALAPRSSDRVDLDATFFLYGDGPADPRLGLGYLLLRLMDVSVKVYPGGFSGWLAEARSPVVRLLGSRELEALLRHDQRLAAGKPLADRRPQSFVLFDLREDWDYGDGHIPGAVSLPERLFAERFEAVVREVRRVADPGSLPLVFYCYGRDCTRSRTCATLAAQKGFRNLLWFREGMTGWVAAGAPEAR